MRAEEPAIEKISASAARQKWGRLLNRVFQGEARVIVERSGLPIAAIISIADLDRLLIDDVKRRQISQVFEEIWAVNKDADPEEVSRDVAEEITAMRAERSVSKATRRPA